MLHRYLYLAFLPSTFVDPALAPPGKLGTEAWLERLPARPTVHASLRTIFHRTPSVFAAVIQGLREEEMAFRSRSGATRDIVTMPRVCNRRSSSFQGRDWLSRSEKFVRDGCLIMNSSQSMTRA
jgi:hypothetical protein